jgi:hypothetical protein
METYDPLPNNVPQENGPFLFLFWSLSLKFVWVLECFLQKISEGDPIVSHFIYYCMWSNLEGATCTWNTLAFQPSQNEGGAVDIQSVELTIFKLYEWMTTILEVESTTKSHGFFLLEVGHNTGDKYA